MTHTNRTARAGFSFLEILAAITIIGILTAIGFGVFRYISDARRTATEANLKSLQLAVDSYYNDALSYPATLDDLQRQPAGAKKWRGPYIDKEPRDSWGSPFGYQVNPKGSKRSYELYSWGPNKEGSPAEEHISVWEI